MDYQAFQVPGLFSVKGKVAIVTGGGSGVGRGMTTALAMNGAKVIICGRRVEQIEITANEINAEAHKCGGEVVAIQADVGTKQGVVDFYAKCGKSIDKLDFLVNNAGFSSNWKDQSPMDDPKSLATKLFSIEDADFANMTAIHVAGPYFLAVKFIPLFQKSSDPSVCNITSLAAFFLQRACCEYSYAQSKAAESHLTQLMAAALQPFSIRVNSVAPGLFPSGLTINPAATAGSLWPPMQAQIDNGKIPAKRAGKWEEIAGPVLMLASPAGAYCNGLNMIVDGGWNLNASGVDV